MFFYQELYFDSLMSQNKLVQYIANSMILKSDIILLLISNNKEADGFFFFKKWLSCQSKGLHKPQWFLFLEVVLVGCIPGSKSSVSERTTLYDKRSNIQWYREDKRFHNLLCFGSSASKWQQIITFGEKTNTDQIVFSFGQNICQTFDFNNIVFLYTRFTYNTCYTCLKRNYSFKINWKQRYLHWHQNWICKCKYNCSNVLPFYTKPELASPVN